MATGEAAERTMARPGGSLGMRALRQDRGIQITGSLLIAMAALAWIGVIRQAVAMTGSGEMAEMEGTAATSPISPMPVDFSLGAGAAFVVAWGVMMAAMMLPSATPMILLYHLAGRNMAGSDRRIVPTFLFSATYVATWLAIGVPVYLASTAVAAAAQMSAAIAGALPYALAGVLVAAGAYQFTAIKRVCLTHCQHPLSFVMHRWRAGYVGTLRLGLEHALYCVGCCWGLMAVLVAAVAMGLNWVLLIAATVFAEKLLPHSEWTARGVGLALVALGAAVALRPELAAALRGQAMMT